MQVARSISQSRGPDPVATFSRGSSRFAEPRRPPVVRVRVWVLVGTIDRARPAKPSAALIPSGDAPERLTIARRNALNPMVSGDLLSGELERLVLDCIPSVVHLEALLLLRQRASEAVSAATLGALLFVEPATALSAVHDLVAKGLVAAMGAQGPFRYGPSPPERCAVVDALAEVHRTRLVPLSRFIHEHAQARSIRDFADAFRLRKD